MSFPFLGPSKAPLQELSLLFIGWGFPNLLILIQFLILSNSHSVFLEEVVCSHLRGNLIVNIRARKWMLIFILGRAVSAWSSLTFVSLLYLLYLTKSPLLICHFPQLCTYIQYVKLKLSCPCLLHPFLSPSPHHHFAVTLSLQPALCPWLFPPRLTDVFPPPEMVEERGLARPVVAGIVATICFLAAAVLFSTMAACFVNKQRRRKLKRKRGEGKIPTSISPQSLSQLRFFHVVR